MRSLIAIALLAILSGCAAPTPPPSTSTPPAGADEYLLDEIGDADARYDIVRANFTELNGSLVIWVEIKNYASGLPLVEARIGTSMGEHFVRLVPDPKKPTTPQVRAEAGNGDVYDACWLPSFPTREGSEEPWWILLEVLHNRTRLDAGGVVNTLSVKTTDIYGNLQDEASHEEEGAVAGGENPYVGQSPECPLIHERGTLY